MLSSPLLPLFLREISNGCLVSPQTLTLTSVVASVIIYNKIVQLPALYGKEGL